MANGFALPILTHLKALMGMNYAAYKITPAGLIAAAIENNPSIQVVSIDGQALAPGMKLNTPSGQIRDVQVKYLQRLSDSVVDTSDNCTNDAFLQYKEQSITAPLFRKLSFYLDWNFLERYQADAIAMTTAGNPSIPVLNEFVTQLMACANALVSSMDKGLLNTPFVFGVNKSTGNNTVKTVNINKDATVLDLQQGMLDVLFDYAQNEMYGTPIIVGNGYIDRLEMATNLGTAQNGLNPAGLKGSYKFYRDNNTIATWGANQFAAIMPGSLGFVDIDKYIGWKTGKFGLSEFLQIDIPVSTDPTQPAKLMRFNLQIKEFDCPQSQVPTPGYGDGTENLGRGYQCILSKNFGLWQPPTDIYGSTDVLTGVNGALRYALTNTCVSC